MVRPRFSGPFKIGFGFAPRTQPDLYYQDNHVDVYDYKNVRCNQIYPPSLHLESSNVCDSLARVSLIQRNFQPPHCAPRAGFALVTVTTRTHTALDVVFVQLVTKVITRILAATVGMMDQVLGAKSYSWHKFERFPSLVMRDILVTMIQ